MNLAVWVQKQQMGTLSYDSSTARFSFAYTAEWLKEDSRFPLSPSLPLQSSDEETVEQHSAAVRQFFQNLLPEGQALDDAARVNKVSKANVLGLLHALGKETSGALRITVNGETPSHSHAEPRPLSFDELSTRIRQRPELPFTVWDGKVRLSIAGYQDKLAVFEHHDRWFLVEDPGLASTFLLKPDPVAKALAGMTTNELMCLTLARSIGLEVATASLRHVPEPVLAIERFDRNVVSSADATLRVERLHCIDGCQALGLPVEYKYERPHGDGTDVRNIRDGASLKRFFSLLNDSSQVSAPAVGRLKFLRWTIFQVLIGNTDAHAKNVSFFSGADGLRLTPTYDLVCGLAFASAGVDDSLAMAIGDNFDPLTIKGYDWAQVASENNLAPRLVANELTRLAQSSLLAMPKVEWVLQQQHADLEMLRRVRTVVEQQCTTALASANNISAIYNNHFKQVPLERA
ncbi:MAG: type II toxin-antitoxin system toxin serine/threonine-protein kinase HipA [Burkholderiaceae bacterium]